MPLQDERDWAIETFTVVDQYRLTFDWDTNQIAPLCPTAVVVAYVVVAEDEFHNNPCVGRTLPNAAVGDDLVTVAFDPFIAVELHQFFLRFVRSIFGNGLAPRDVDCAGDMSGALGSFCHSGWRDDLTAVFRRG